MDPTITAILPGVQSLVTAILTDGWAHLRTSMARRWSRQTSEPQAEIESRLDVALSQSEEFAGDAEGREALLRAYWAGYLAAVLAERPDLLDLVAGLRSPSADAAGSTTVQNTNSGTVTTLVQASEIQGGVTFGA